MELSPITFFGPRSCRQCKKTAIEIYDYYGNPIGYEAILARKAMGLESGLDHRAIYEMKCRNCGVKYQIIWRDGYPYPDIHKEPLSQQFIKSFKEGT